MTVLRDGAVHATVVGDLDHVPAPLWDELLAASPTREVFQTRAWHLAWWSAFSPGRLLAAVVRRAGRPVALAPLYVAGDMCFLVGSGGADYLDVVGTVDADVLDAVLDAAEAAVPGLIGVRLHHIPDTSPTGPALEAAVARRPGWTCWDEGHLVAPAMRVAGDPGGARAAADKRSLRRHERGLARDRPLRFDTTHDGAQIAPHLDAFFTQHERRWAGTTSPSLFTDPRQRAFYRALTRAAAGEGWLHFARLIWGDEPVAHHFGFWFGGSLLWYKPAFAVEHARRSPGEVLLRRLIGEALVLGARELDLGLGEEPFKARFATHARTVRTWAAYAPGVA